MITYANGRIASWGRTADGKDDGGVIVLALVADESDKTKTDKLSSHLGRFLTTDNGGKIAEPLEGSKCGKAVAMRDGSSRAGGLAICDIHELYALCTLVVCGCEIEVLV